MVCSQLWWGPAPLLLSGAISELLLSSPAVPPSFSSAEPVVTSVLEGQPVRLACECHGVPFPTLSWRKDGRDLFLILIPPYICVDPPDGYWSPQSKKCLMLDRVQLLVLLAT